MGSKLESELVRDWCSLHDIVVLSETKTTASPSVPGFVAVNNSKHRHGGVAVLIKRYLYPSVCHLDIDDEGTVWFELSCIPGVIFCGMYNEPSDSSYFWPETFASIPAHLESGKLSVIVGDMNARLGSRIHLLDEANGLTHDIVDNTVNSNGRALVQTCIANQLTPINNLKIGDRVWKGNLTYRKKQRWISEVDLCLVFSPLAEAVSHFAVDQNLKYPSDHAPVSVGIDFSCCINSCRIDELVERSKMLGSYEHLLINKNHTKRPIPYRFIDRELFIQNIDETPLPDVEGATVDDILENVSDELYKCAARSKRTAINHHENAAKPSNRWQRIIAAKDSRTLWKGIDWNGKYQETTLDEGPTEAAFQDHLERLLNPADFEPIVPDDLATEVSIPILDEPLKPEELLHVVEKQLKPDKSCDVTGLSPGVLKMLPITWLGLLLTIFNMLFLTGSYPVSWTISKLIMLFKKGLVMMCGNYRGITIMNVLSKCYDYLLHNRLMKWYSPCREQAGAQPKRGCTEHFVALRMIIDLFMKTKTPLFIAFIDFSKAYDRVPRSYMLKLLKRLGCGKVMIAALTSMYTVTQFLLGTTLITAVLGVKQGSPSSCFLFTLFVDELVRFMKLSPPDGLLGWLHLLVLMDDTVLLATSHEKLCQKLDILAKWCDQSGMVLNEDKTQYMSFNSSEKRPITLKTHAGVVTVSHCSEYVYLGCVVTSDGKISSSIAKHVSSRGKSTNKLVRFLDKNENAPFSVKKTVVDACFYTSLLYGCESWLEERVSPELEQLYMKGIKRLLGVRSQTTTDVALLESGYPSLRALLKSRQKVFLEKMVKERENMDDDPFMHVLRLTMSNNTTMAAYIRSLQTCPNFIDADKRARIERVRSSTRTKSATYASINPTFEIHPVYQHGVEAVDDYLRITFTRFRTSSHRLKVETGRWSRIPRERRLCQCGEGVQTEKHVLVECELTRGIREKYGQTINSFETFMTSEKSKAQLHMLHEILALFED